MRPAGLTARFTGLRFIDREGTICQVFALQLLHGGLGRAAVRHFYKAKSPRTASVAVGNQINRVHSAIRFKKLAKVLFRRGEGKIAYKKQLP
jgi:hypothetical protein